MGPPELFVIYVVYTVNYIRLVPGMQIPFRTEVTVKEHGIFNGDL